MADGWFRDTSDNKLVAAADSDFTPPSGHDFILLSTIKAAYDDEIWQGGTWDGTNYVPPDNIIVPFDTSTPLGQKQEACQAFHDSLMAARGAIMNVAPEKIQLHVQWLLQFEAMGHWANYVCAHMTSITNAQFIAWAGKSSLGPDGVTSIQDLFEQVHQLTDAKIPQEACAWVDPADASVVVALDVARMNSTQGDNPYFDGETVDLYDIDLRNGAWIRELTS